MPLPTYTAEGSDLTIYRAPLALVIDDDLNGTRIVLDLADLDLFLSAAAEQFPTLYQKHLCQTDTDSQTNK